MDKLIALSSLLLTLAFASTASIGENFQRAGLEMDWSGYTSYDYDEGGWWSWYNSLSFRIGTFVVDGLSLGGGLDYHAATYGSGSASHGPTLTLGARWYFGYDPGSLTGPCHSVGLDVDNSFTFSEYDPAYQLAITPSYRFLYFIQERIAPSIGLSATNRVYASNGAGYGFHGVVNFGFYYFMKSSDQVWVGK